MTLTVVIPAYNAQAHLTAAVTSVLASTIRPDEVILVDDASTDQTLALMHRLADEHPEIHVLAQPVNSGPAAARNLALDAAQSTWVAVHDADDTVSPGRFEAMLAAGEQTGADVVLDNFVFVDARTGARRPSRIPAGPGEELVDRYRFFDGARAFNRAPTWTLLQPVFRRTFLESGAVRYPTHSRHGEDFLLMAEVFLRGARCVRVRNPGYLYTQRAGGVSTTRTDYRGLVDQTTTLLADPRVAADPRASRLLRRRLATLRCLDAERRGRGALALAAVRSPGVTSTLARRGTRTVLRRIRPLRDALPELL